MLRARSACDQGRSVVAKEKQAGKKVEAAAPQAPPPAGLLRRLLSLRGWLRANPLRGSLALSALVVAFIGLAVGLTLTFRPAPRPTYIRQLAQSFAEFDR